MARIRTIKPEFWQDEKLAQLDPLTRLVFIGLFSIADDAGRLVDNLKHIDGFLFPETEDSARDSLVILASLSRILRYTSASGQRLVQVVNWSRHQKVDNPNKYTLPAPTAEDMARLGVADSSPDTREILARPSRNPRVTTNDLRSTTNDQLQQPVAADAPTRTPEPVGLAVVEGNTLLGALERAPDLPTMVPPDPPPRPPGMGLVRGGSAAVQRFSAGSYADVTGHLGVVLAEVTTGAARRFRADEKREVMALMLGAYWAAKLHKHPERVKFTKRRVSQLVRVLRENEDDLSELFYVVDGAVRDDYCQGRTQKQHGEKVIELEFLFGSRDRIERLAGHCAGYKAGETHPRVRQIVGDSEGEVVNG
jgi:hypothetical protein